MKEEAAYSASPLRAVWRWTYVTWGLIVGATLVSALLPQAIEFVSAEAIIAKWAKLKTDHTNLVDSGLPEFANYYVITFYNLWNLTVALTLIHCVAISLTIATQAQPYKPRESEVSLSAATAISCALFISSYCVAAYVPTGFRLPDDYYIRRIPANRASAVWLLVVFIALNFSATIAVTFVMWLLRASEKRKAQKG